MASKGANFEKGRACVKKEGYAVSGYDTSISDKVGDMEAI